MLKSALITFYLHYLNHLYFASCTFQRLDLHCVVDCCNHYHEQSGKSIVSDLNYTIFLCVHINTTRHTNTVLLSLFCSSLSPWLYRLSHNTRGFIRFWDHLHKHSGRWSNFYLTGTIRLNQCFWYVNCYTKIKTNNISSVLFHLFVYHHFYHPKSKSSLFHCL